jgi:hypothetical protein
MLVQDFIFHTAEKTDMLVWVVTLYSLVAEYEHLEETYCLVLPQQ